MRRRRIVGLEDGRALARLIARLSAAGAREIRVDVGAGTVHADLGAGEVAVVAGDHRLRDDGTVVVAGEETAPEALPPRGPCRVPAGGVRSSPTSEDALTRTDAVAPPAPTDKPERV